MKYKSVDDYIASQPVDSREKLEQVRSIIQAVVPKAEELISYMIPCYKYDGMLVGFGVNKKGCSFYTMNTKILKDHLKELKNFSYSGSTLHINKEQKIPVALIKKIIKQRIRENKERAKLKGQSIRNKK